MINYTNEFELLWKIAPKRAGGNSKAAAFKCYNRRIKEGYSRADIGQGLQRYKEFCVQTNKIGTEYVMMLSTFFNKDERFLEDWALPDKKINESVEDKAKRLGIVARIGETQTEFDNRIQQTRE